MSTSLRVTVDLKTFTQTAATWVAVTLYEARTRQSKSDKCSQNTDACLLFNNTLFSRPMRKCGSHMQPTQTVQMNRMFYM